MRKYHLVALVGVMLLVAGLAMMTQPVVVAQDMEEPPYLADYYNAWMMSGHADKTAEAFVHWDADGVVSARCAKCHSEGGYLDFLGADGSEAGTVDADAALGTSVTCDVCHAPEAVALTSVTFPSGMVVNEAEGTARCMECHQGRSSGATVMAAIDKLALADVDTVSAELSFVNIHYYAAAASLYGSEVGGGYQYDGMIYQMKNEHVEGYATCSDCHDPHTLELKVAECATCHEDVETAEDLKFIRMQGSGSDYDGDGDTLEGIAQEIETLQEMLYASIQAYVADVVGTPIAYDVHSHPYFFIDTDANGVADEAEVNSDNRYNAFTPRLLKAAYNYQVSLKDHGGYAHNPQYHVHLLVDSINDLAAATGTEANVTRNDPGHFNVTEEAFRHWDADGEVPASCTKCHTDSGLPFYLENNVTIAMEPSNSLSCTTCHDSVSDFTVYAVNEVTFPSGSVVSFGEGDSNNLCISCHQGRESTTSVNTAIARAGVGPNEVTDKLSFRNIHYFASGATLFGTEAKGGYEFSGKEYNGRNLHDGEDMTTCTSCHQPHTGELALNECEDCHDAIDLEEVRLIRVTEDVELVDYDGDGNAEEPIRDEIAAFSDALYVAMQDYTTNLIGKTIIYDSHAYPYFFEDTNGNGERDADDARYTMWTPALLQAAYNFQFAAKDPGNYAHNPHYTLQVVFDSIEAIGGPAAVAGLTRPVVVKAE